MHVSPVKRIYPFPARPVFNCRAWCVISHILSLALMSDVAAGVQCERQAPCDLARDDRKLLLCKVCSSRSSLRHCCSLMNSLPLVLHSICDSGCQVVSENLETHAQVFFSQHESEVSTLAIQHDGMQLASASSGTLVSCLVAWRKKKPRLT